jgi:hypothetical protein
MSIGLRLAATFLHLFGAATILPLVLVAFPTVVASLIRCYLVREALPTAFAGGFGSLVVFLILLEIVLGVVWLERHLTHRPYPFAPRWKAGPPGHPLRLLCIPALRIVAVYGLTAVCIWIASCFQNDITLTWAWPLAWGSVGGGAFALSRHLDRTLPR